MTAAVKVDHARIHALAEKILKDAEAYERQTDYGAPQIKWGNDVVLAEYILSLSQPRGETPAKEAIAKVFWQYRESIMAGDITAAVDALCAVTASPSTSQAADGSAAPFVDALIEIRKDCEREVWHDIKPYIDRILSEHVCTGCWEASGQKYTDNCGEASCPLPIKTWCDKCQETVDPTQCSIVLCPVRKSQAVGKGDGSAALGAAEYARRRLVCAPDLVLPSPPTQSEASAAPTKSSVPSTEEREALEEEVVKTMCAGAIQKCRAPECPHNCQYNERVRAKAILSAYTLTKRPSCTGEELLKNLAGAYGGGLGK